VTDAIGALPPPELMRSPDGGDIGPLQTGWRLGLREFSQNKLAVAGLAVLAFFVLLCFAGPLVYHANVLTVNLNAANTPPGAGHPLGTDNEGIDVLGEIMKGGQAALEIGFMAAIFATIFGALWGAISGLVGGILDSAMMRIVDVLLSIPFLFVVLIVSVRFVASVWSLSLILGAFTWLVPARLVRGEVLTLKTRDFVSAARIAGAGQWRLINRHLLPNALSVIIVNVTFNVADSILAVSYLGFLGFGLHYPSYDWGDMVNNGTTYMQDGYWWLIYPVGFCIVATVMACNLIGDALRDALDVRLRSR
jgi:ABC-type dipeptide/oligopeptide/nickel transport system permease subunit